MNAALEFLSGKKTYIVSALGLIVCGLWMYGVIDDAMAAKALTALGFGGAITLRAATAAQQTETQELKQQVAALRRGGEYPVA